MSACCFGAGTLGNGWILASYHCRGTDDVARDVINMLAIVWQNMGAVTQRYQNGSPLSPTAVG